MFDPEISALAAQTLEQYRAAGLRIVTAESCTGGLVAGALTEISGSSAVVMQGYITYSNTAKTMLLGVSAALIAEHGAVSEPVARAMALGALRGLDDSHVAAAVTGIAGPGGATAEKPVGTVHIATARGNETRHQKFLFAGNRHAVRLQAVEAALTMIAKHAA